MSWLLLKFPPLHGIRREGSENCSPRRSPAQHVIYGHQCWNPSVHLSYLWSSKKNLNMTTRKTDKQENLASHFSCTETLKPEGGGLIFAICCSLSERDETMVWGATLQSSKASNRSNSRCRGNGHFTGNAPCCSSVHVYKFPRCPLTSPSKVYCPWFHSKKSLFVILVNVK